MKLFTASEFKIILIALGGAAALAVIITLIAGSSGRPRASEMTAEDAFVQNEIPDITDIIIPEEFTLTGGERWYFFREPVSRWNEEQIRQFWIDPAEIGVNVLERESNQVIDNFVQNLP
ncbi:MAG: hypothetical protein HN368_15720 [Spirochaetales bacterium]|jgi:hypothetical protein|nr:hypothetical protein [Spirochaetales bacterium]